MPPVSCPILGCDFVTDDLDAVIVATLIITHGTTHLRDITSAAKVEKVKQLIISTAGSSEEWSYFKSQWSEYVAATKITGQECVVQLLECCDDPLRPYTIYQYPHQNDCG
ncbi:hypothetical protein CAPTEDRAFT_209230 [Capitella teleta]|uniref:Uncharacterized protein n=1 Tax=Capitella teleta TaxID=283909 RepID=R7VLZ6_CAPTE|nr:hypothetical protein CAPTEDRAFT_209230 [Capitella teleta]|eukprot:ELU18676.1 hypothetical protein CAPTEDRAFT_209230 [Capitella teleta]